MVFKLNDNDIIFPDTALAEEDGLLAVGGDLSVERLSAAYKSGIFPWYSAGEPICWYAPHKRCVILKGNIRVSKSMQKVIKKGGFLITKNTVFAEVVHACKTVPRHGQDGTWITDEMENAYVDLHNAGIAHSIEVWHQNKLVGGLYGVQMGNIFCGESMYSKMENASKMALIWLCNQPELVLVDCQLKTDHLISMGAEMISQTAYKKYLQSHASTNQNKF